MADAITDDKTSPPPYIGQPAYGPQPFTHQPGYPMSNIQPGYPMSNIQPGYPMSNIQPGYPMSNIQPAQGHNTTTVVMPPPTVLVQNRPASWIGLSIFNCLCCFWPLGLVAMVFSCMVDSSYDSGDYENAKKYSNIAKWLNIVSVICGVIVIVVVIIVVAAGGSSSSSSSY